MFPSLNYLLKTNSPEVSHIYHMFLEAIRDTFTRPPERPSSNDLELVLQDYEAVYRRVGRIWNTRVGLERRKAIYQAFPVIKQLIASDQPGKFEGEFNPSNIALNVLLFQRGIGKKFSTVKCLKMSLAKARKIRRARKPINVQFAPVDRPTLNAPLAQAMPQEFLEESGKNSATNSDHATY